MFLDSPKGLSTSRTPFFPSYSSFFSIIIKAHMDHIIKLTLLKYNKLLILNLSPYEFIIGFEVDLDLVQMGLFFFH